jgi:hypothetical protein
VAWNAENRNYRIKSISGVSPGAALALASRPCSLATSPVEVTAAIWTVGVALPLLTQMYGPAVRCKRFSAICRLCGLASMYPAFDWSVLCSWPS